MKYFRKLIFCFFLISTQMFPLTAPESKNNLSPWFLLGLAEGIFIAESAISYIDNGSTILGAVNGLSGAVLFALNPVYRPEDRWFMNVYAGGLGLLSCYNFLKQDPVEKGRNFGENIVGYNFILVAVLITIWIDKPSQSLSTQRDMGVSILSKGGGNYLTLYKNF